jgi:hypothetical protein
MNRINQQLFKETSILPLVAFRIIFGMLLIIGTLRFLCNGWVEQLYIKPDFYFGFFEFIQPLPGNWMYLPFSLLLIGAFGIVFGAYYRISSLVAFLSFTYIEVLDKTNYLNHYYFVSLVLLLLCIVPANAYFSWDIKRKTRIQKKSVPQWTIGIFQFQLGVVYFFAGVAKINSDWILHAQPLSIWLQAYRDLPILGDFFTAKWVAYAFSWFGCVYDISITFFLLMKKTRPFAYFFVIVFHIVTWALFPIGVFPWVMIFSTLIFFPANFHQKWIGRLEKLLRWKEKNHESLASYQPNKSISVFVWVFVILQLILPIRCLLNDPQTLFWHEEGMRFSWRVMLMHKEGFATFYVRDSISKREIQVRNEDFLTEGQIDQMSTQPDMIKQYADYLYEQFNDSILSTNEGNFLLKNPSIHGEIFVSLNGRNAQLFLSKKHNLHEKKYTFAPHRWLAPFNPSI